MSKLKTKAIMSMSGIPPTTFPPKDYSKPIARDKKQLILIALEVIFGVIGLSVGLYMAYHYGLGSNALIAISCAGVGGVLTIAIATLVCMRKKKSPTISESHASNPIKVSHLSATQQKAVISSSVEVSNLPPKINGKPVEGKIAIYNYRTSGALGTKIAHLPQKTKDIERTDFKNWREFPNEMLIQCEIIIEEKNPFPYELYLPFCLFIQDDDYNKWKKEGDIVEFIYQKKLYQLTIAQAESNLQMPFDQLIKLCEVNFYTNKGRSIFSSETGPTFDSTSFLSPIDVQKHKDLVSKAVKLNKECDLFNLPFSVELPIEPPFTLYEDGLVCDLIGVEDQNMQVFATDEYFFVYGKRTFSKHLMGFKGIVFDPEAYPAFSPKEYLLMLKWTDTFTKEAAMSAKKTTHNGQLIITLDKVL